MNTCTNSILSGRTEQEGEVEALEEHKPPFELLDIVEQVSVFRVSAQNSSRHEDERGRTRKLF